MVKKYYRVVIDLTNNLTVAHYLVAMKSESEDILYFKIYDEKLTKVIVKNFFFGVDTGIEECFIKLYKEYTVDFVQELSAMGFNFLMEENYDNK